MVAIFPLAKEIKENTQVIGIFQPCLRACTGFNAKKVILTERGKVVEKLGNLVDIVNITCRIVVCVLHNYIIQQEWENVNRKINISRNVY